MRTLFCSNILDIAQEQVHIVYPIALTSRIVLPNIAIAFTRPYMKPLCRGSSVIYRATTGRESTG